MERGLPKAEFRLRKRHALFLVDLVIAAAVFLGVGRYYADHRREEIVARKAQLQAEAELRARHMITEADSVMEYKRTEVARMRADSVAKFSELAQKFQTLQAGLVQGQELKNKVNVLTDVVQDLKAKAVLSSQKVEEYKANLDDRLKTESSLQATAEDKKQVVAQTEEERAEASRKLHEAIQTRTYEPVGMFPDRSGVMVRQEMASGDAQTGLEVQHVLKNTGATDMGVAVGIGLGSGDRASSKQVGLLLSRSLVHRRLGLDLSAGYAYLANDAGKGDPGAYANAALKFSPFYRERFHLSLGAQATNGELLPYFGVGLGRR